MEKQPQIAIVEAWMRDVSKSLGMELSLNEEGACCFQIGESTIIGIEVSADLSMVNLFSPLLALPDDKDLAGFILIKALELNAFQALTRGGAIAIASGGGPLFYCYSTPIEGGSSAIFSKILGEFYKTIPILKRLLLESPTQNAAENPPLSPLLEKQGYLRA